MRCISTFFFLIISYSLLGQGEANNWYFGQNAGINFSTTPPTVLTDGRIDTLEGCTTISDAIGNLLFYTDGSFIYTRNHQLMQNGTGLKGDTSSTSSALIVPQPNTPNIYIVFTVDEPHHDNADGDPSTSDGDGINNGLLYSIVDMSLDGGNGAVITGQKNKPLITYNTTNTQESLYKCSEKITAVKSDDCNSFWVITHFIDTYYAFSIDQTGVNTTPVISRVGVNIPISGYRRNALGYLKASPEGDKLAVAHLGLATTTGADGPGKVLLYDFDNTTGIVSNEIELYDGDAPYGIEFSQSGERLYTTIGIGDRGINDGFLMQFDLTLPTPQIATSGTRILNENGQETSEFSAGALQLGPDGRIYRALFNFDTATGNYLGVIENPEALGTNVNYTDRSILINTDGNRASRIGLPPFIQSIFAQTIDIINNGNTNNINLTLCEGDIYRLTYQHISTATYTWFIDNVPLTDTTHFLDITTTGNYRLEVNLNDGSCPLIGTANATFLEVPSIENIPLDEKVCDPDNDGIVSIDLSIYTPPIIGSQDTNQFRVRYFRSLTDANTVTNELPNTYTTETNPQTIVVRIENIEHIDCYNIANFEIEILNTPTAFAVNPIILCDNTDDGNGMNGMVNYDITTLNSLIYNGQSPTDYTLTYHTTLIDAQTNSNIIADPTNTVLTTTMTAIYARIENNLSIDCFDTLEIPVTIQVLPVANPTSLIQCDAYNNPTDGITLFNLEEAISQITTMTTNHTVLFFDNQSSAITGSPFITNTTDYQNTSPTQQLFARVTNDISGCYKITTVDLSSSSTSANDTRLELCDDDGTEDGFREFDLTQATSQVVQGITTPNLSIKYYASINNALSEINPIITYTNTISGTQGQEIIYARVEDNLNQCFGITEVSLYVHPLPDIETQAEVFFCNTNHIVTINAGLQSGSNIDFNYLWSTGETTENISVTAAGQYTVIVTNQTTNCSKTKRINVTTSSIATILPPTIIDASVNNTVTINYNGAGDYEFTISFNDSNIRTYQDSPIFTNVPPGFHTIYIRDKNGCGEVKKSIAVVGFPRYFTPNGDMIHPTWNVLGISADIVGNSLIYIFDRHGKLLKQLTARDQGWNGTYKGQLMPSGEYWFRTQLEDGRIIKGSFSLIR